MRKKIIWVVVAILVLLVFTNPSQSDFKNFAELKSNRKNIICSRTGYYFFFSIYEHNGDSPNRFIGALKNFFSLKPPDPLPEVFEKAKQDSIAVFQKAYDDSAAAVNDMAREKAIQDSADAADEYRKYRK